MSRTRNWNMIGCLLCIFIFVAGILAILPPSALGAQPAGEKWVNLYNITGLEQPQIVRLSPDGSTVCIYDREGYSAELWDVRSETKITLIDAGSVITDFEYSPNGTLIAIARGPGFERYGLVAFWASNGTFLPDVFVPTANWTGDLGWSPDGGRIALGTREGEVFIIDTTNWLIVGWTRLAASGEIMSLAYSPDGRLLAVLPSNGICTILDAATLEVRALLDNQATHFTSELSWSFDGALLSCPRLSGDVGLYNTTTFKIKRNIWVGSVSFSPTRDYYVVGYGVGDADVCYIENETEAFRFSGILGNVDLISWSGDGNSIALGSKEDSTVRVCVDVMSPSHDRPPRVFIDSPRDGEVISADGVTVLGRAEDDGTVAFVLVRVDDRPWGVANGTASWSLAVDLGGLPDGRHMLRAMACDGRQFSTTCTTAFLLDVPPALDLPPWVTVLFPLDGYRTDEDLPTYGSCGDDVAVERVEVRFLNLTISLYPDANGVWDWVMPLGQTPDGPYVLSTRAYDGAQWSPYANVTVIVSRGPPPPGPPLVSIGWPADNEHVWGIINVTGTVVPPVPSGIVVVEVDGSPAGLAEGYGDWRFELDTGGLAPGPHAIGVWAFDGALTSPKAVMTAVVDPEGAPEVVVLQPMDGGYVQGDLRVSGFVRKGYGDVMRVELSLNGGEWVSTSSPGFWNHTFDETELRNGTNVIRVRASDPYSTSDVVILTVGYVNSFYVVIVSPVAGAHVKDDVPVKGTVVGGGNGNITVEVLINGGAWSYACDGRNWTCLVKVSELVLGTNTIEARAYDGEEWSANFTVKLRLDEYPSSPEASTGWHIVVAMLLLILLLTGIYTLYLGRKLKRNGRRSE